MVTIPVMNTSPFRLKLNFQQLILLLILILWRVALFNNSEWTRQIFKNNGLLLLVTRMQVLSSLISSTLQLNQPPIGNLVKLMPKQVRMNLKEGFKVTITPFTIVIYQ